jgi:hypothetical protein
MAMLTLRVERALKLNANGTGLAYSFDFGSTTDGASVYPNAIATPSPLIHRATLTLRA